MALKLTKQLRGLAPITLTETKEWLRVDFTSDDNLIKDLIFRSIDIVEKYLDASINSYTITLTASPRKELKLPYTPVKSITSVQDDNGADLSYEYDGFCITLGSGTMSVTTGISTPKPFVVEYEAGYDLVPDGLKTGILEVIAQLYENRGDSTGFNYLLYHNQNLTPYKNKIWI